MMTSQNQTNNNIYKQDEMNNFVDTRVGEILIKLEPIRHKILNHQLNKSIKNIEDLRIFMAYHVFSVWDFMCLLKTMQKNLTCVESIWYPKGNSNTRFLVNEIVLGEESDIDMNGIRKSHFEMYLDAMNQAGAATSQIKSFIEICKRTQSIEEAFEWSYSPKIVREFVNYTFKIISSDKPHLQAAAFTFGREHLIPDMFTSIVNDINNEFPNTLSNFKYYLDRHIEIDGDHHSKLAIEMTKILCNNDKAKWDEAEKVAIECLEKRLELWDAIYERIINNKKLQ